MNVNKQLRERDLWQQAELLLWGVFGDYQYMEDGDWERNLIDPAAQIENATILVNRQQKQRE